MREGVSARRGNVVGGADDKWRCLFAGNRGANGFDCGALARKRSRWRKHATPSSHPKNNEEIEDGDSSRTRYLIITLLHSPGNSEERARTARRPISSLLARNNCLCHNPFGHAPRQGLPHQRYNGVRCAVVTVGLGTCDLALPVLLEGIHHAHHPWLEVK